MVPIILQIIILHEQKQKSKCKYYKKESVNIIKKEKRPAGEGGALWNPVVVTTAL